MQGISKETVQAFRDLREAAEEIKGRFARMHIKMDELKVATKIAAISRIKQQPFYR